MAQYLPHVYTLETTRCSTQRVRSAWSLPVSPASSQWNTDFHYGPACLPLCIISPQHTLVLFIIIITLYNKLTLHLLVTTNLCKCPWWCETQLNWPDNSSCRLQIEPQMAVIKTASNDMSSCFLLPQQTDDASKWEKESCRQPPCSA